MLPHWVPREPCLKRPNWPREKMKFQTHLGSNFTRGAIPALYYLKKRLRLLFFRILELALPGFGGGVGFDFGC